MTCFSTPWTRRCSRSSWPPPAATRSELVEQALDRARAAKWPTGLAFAHYAAGLAIIDTDPAASLEAFNRAVAIAAEVGNRQAEALAQTIVIHLQSALLPRAELAVALIRLLRHLQQSGDTTTALLTLSQSRRAAERRRAAANGGADLRLARWTVRPKRANPSVTTRLPSPQSGNRSATSGICCSNRVAA